MKADYILQYKGVKLAVVEAKSDEKPVEHLSKLTRNRRKWYPDLMTSTISAIPFKRTTKRPSHSAMT